VKQWSIITTPLITAICPIISKVFEHCLLESFQLFLCSDDNQFGFKKGVGSGYAIHTVCNIVDQTDQYNKAGYTANMYALDLSEAYDKVNHHAL